MAEVCCRGSPVDPPKFDEKHAEEHPVSKAPPKKVEEEEEEDEDIDALVEDLESQDGHIDVSLAFLARSANKKILQLSACLRDGAKYHPTPSLVLRRIPARLPRACRLRPQSSFGAPHVQLAFSHSGSWLATRNALRAFIASWILRR